MLSSQKFIMNDKFLYHNFRFLLVVLVLTCSKKGHFDMGLHQIHEEMYSADSRSNFALETYQEYNCDGTVQPGLVGYFEGAFQKASSRALDFILSPPS